MVIEIYISCYPKLAALPPDEQKQMVKLLLNYSYHTFYEREIKETPQILEKLDKICSTLTPTITGSSKKGKFNEDLMDNFFIETFKDYEYVNTHTTPHSGDAIMSKKGLKIMLEYKSYSNSIPTQEVTKFKRDLKEKNIKHGIMLSSHTSICNKNDFDIEMFDDGFTIVYISKVSQLNRWDLVESAVRLQEMFYNTHAKKLVFDVVSVKLESINAILVDVEKISVEYSNTEEKIRSSLYHFSNTLTKSLDKIRRTIDEVCNIPTEIEFSTSELVGENFKFHKILMEKVLVLFSLHNIKFNVVSETEIEVVHRGKIICNKTNVYYMNTFPEIKVALSNETWHNTQSFFEKLLD